MIATFKPMTVHEFDIFIRLFADIRRYASPAAGAMLVAAKMYARRRRR